MDEAGQRAATSLGCRRAVCTPVARVRRAITRSCPGWVAITRFAPPDAGCPFRRPPPAFRRRDRWRAEGDARRAEGGATPVGAWPLRRRAAWTPVAQVRGAMTAGWPKSAVSGCHNALRAGPVPAPAARGPSPRPPAGGWGCAGAEGAASLIGAGPARIASDIRAGRYFRVPRLGGITRFAYPDVGSRHAARRARRLESRQVFPRKRTATARKPEKSK